MTEPYQVTPKPHRVLLCLYRLGPSTVFEIEEKIDMTRADITSVLCAEAARPGSEQYFRRAGRRRAVGHDREGAGRPRTVWECTEVPPLKPPRKKGVAPRNPKPKPERKTKRRMPAMTEAHKRAISEAQQRVAKERAEKYPHITSGYKVCTKCGERKFFDMNNSDISEFSPMSKRWKDGVTVVKSPHGQCKKCIAERKRAKHASMTPEQLAARNRRRRTTHKKRRRKAIKRVPAGPITDWLRERDAPLNVHEAEYKTYRRLVVEGQKTVHIKTVDHILAYYGSTEELHILYPSQELQRAS